MQLTSVLFWKLQSNSFAGRKMFHSWNSEWQYFALPSEVTQTVELLVGTLQSVLCCMNHSISTSLSSEGPIIVLSSSPCWWSVLPLACVMCSFSTATSSNRPTLRHAVTPLEPWSHKTELRTGFTLWKDPNVVLFPVAFPKRFFNLEGPENVQRRLI